MLLWGAFPYPSPTLRLRHIAGGMQMAVRMVGYGLISLTLAAFHSLLLRSR